jgi:hypothetical protein
MRRALIAVGLLVAFFAVVALYMAICVGAMLLTGSPAVIMIPAGCLVLWGAWGAAGDFIKHPPAWPWRARR